MTITFSPNEIHLLIATLREGSAMKPLGNQRDIFALIDKILSAYPPLELIVGAEEVPEIEIVKE